MNGSSLLVATALALGVVGLGTRAPQEEAVAAEPLVWRADLDEARVEAAAAGKPLLVLVRCPP